MKVFKTGHVPFVIKQNTSQQLLTVFAGNLQFCQILKAAFH
jgi:hypothetical protein